MSPECLDTVVQLAEELRPALRALRRHDGRLHAQLRRAGAALVFHVAEGRGQERDGRRRTLRIAHSDAEELRRALGRVEATGVVQGELLGPARASLERVLALLGPADP